jgi:hypothetical protein
MILSHSSSVSEGLRWPTKALMIQGKARSSGEGPRRARWLYTSGSTSCKQNETGVAALANDVVTYNRVPLLNVSLMTSAAAEQALRCSHSTAH